MPFNPSPSQITFSFAIISTALACIIGLNPPNPNPPGTAKTSQPLLTRLRHFITNGNLNTLINTPITIFAIHTAFLSLTYPNIPSFLLRHGASSLNPDLITWSWHTTPIIILILCIAFPIRITAFRTLGKSFTFKLAKPKTGLVTTGVYKYLQHPSYTGAAVLLVVPMFLLYRREGAMGCWIGELWGWKNVVGLVIERGVVPVTGTGMLWLMGQRVVEEERMLKELFGKEWVEWHKRTKRFIPGVW